MPNTQTDIFRTISATDNEKFKKIVIEVMSEACSADLSDEQYDGIGTLGEKQMHAALKRFICPDRTKHEVKLFGSYGHIKTPDESTQSKRKFVADILSDDTVYEIQTGNFSPLCEKIHWILENTSYNVTVIHPIAESLKISYIESESGKIGPFKRSPHHGRLEDIASELYFFRDFITSKRFSLIIMMMEANQYRKKIPQKNGRRTRSAKYEMIPSSLSGAYFFCNADDYNIFIPQSLPEIFTVQTYSKEAKIYGMDAYSIVKTLCHVGLLEQCGKIGRAVAYKRKTQS